MFYGIPTWLKLVSVIFFIISITIIAYSFQKCGAKAFLLGSGAFPAAVMGLCDK